MDATKRNIEMENLSTGSQDSLEDPTRLRRVAESDDPEDAVVANSPVSEGFLSFFLSFYKTLIPPLLLHETLPILRRKPFDTFYFVLEKENRIHFLV